jgi:hypothetical protein
MEEICDLCTMYTYVYIYIYIYIYIYVCVCVSCTNIDDTFPKKDLGGIRVNENYRQRYNKEIMQLLGN